jgi:DNA invertase Pin-like site-specific DNA recombinase
MKMKLGSYMRVSRMGARQEGAEGFHSTDFAREDVSAWAERHGHEIVRYFQDLNQSGGKFNRPAFNEVLQAIEAGEIDGLVVPYLSRFARSMKVAYEALKVIEAAGGVFISVEEDLVLRSPNDWLNFNLRMSFHEWDLKMKTESWRRVHETRIADGKPMTFPFGYVRGQDGRLVVNPAEAVWVKTIFTMRAEGSGMRAIAQYLNDNGAPTPRGSAVLWTGAGVRRVIQRRTYLGEVSHGTKIKTGAHKPIVDDLLFARANAVQGRPISRTNTHLLAGLLRCANCRRMLKGQHTTRGTGIFYACPGEGANGKCDFPTWVLEGDVLGRLRHDYVRILNSAGGYRFKAVSENSDVVTLRAEVDVLDGRYQDVRGDERLKAIDREQWYEDVENAKAALDAKKEELSLALRTADSLTVGDQGFAWPTDQAGQRSLLTNTFAVVFLRGHSDTSFEHRAFVRGAALPQVPARGKVNDLPPFVWDRNEADTWVALG